MHENKTFDPYFMYKK